MQGTHGVKVKTFDSKRAQWLTSKGNLTSKRLHAAMSTPEREDAAILAAARTFTAYSADGDVLRVVVASNPASVRDAQRDAIEVARIESDGAYVVQGDVDAPSDSAYAIAGPFFDEPEDDDDVAFGFVLPNGAIVVEAKPMQERNGHHSAYTVLARWRSGKDAEYATWTFCTPLDAPAFCTSGAYFGNLPDAVESFIQRSAGL